jgi:hypothetical protein
MSKIIFSLVTDVANEYGRLPHFKKEIKSQLTNIVFKEMKNILREVLSFSSKFQFATLKWPFATSGE